MLNNNYTNTEITQSPTMDYSTKTRKELIDICKETGIKGYSAKNKAEIIVLITKDRMEKNNGPTRTLVTEKNETLQEFDSCGITENVEASVSDSNVFTISNNTNTVVVETNIHLLKECLTQTSIKDVSEKLNLCIGTIKRWLELNDVPIQYTFDLHKILSKNIDYSKFSSSLKDQFFTPKHVAEKCWETFQKETNIDISDYLFIEPSAGDGSFLKILPKNTIGLDIEPRSNGIIKQDYLSWKPTDLSKKYIVFGNPPFGLRGHLALNFINHSYTFADYVCFILPQLFESDGKGSPRKRVKGYNLVYSEGLSAMFYSPDNKDVKVNGVFQIWSKHTANHTYTITPTTEENMKVYSLSDGGTIASTRNKDMIGKCDIYLPSTCFGKDNMKIYNRFDELPGKKGYGVVFFHDKINMIQKANSIDWSLVSFLSTNSAYNLRTSIIFAQFY